LQDGIHNFIEDTPSAAAGVWIPITTFKFHLEGSIFAFCSYLTRRFFFNLFSCPPFVNFERASATRKWSQRHNSGVSVRSIKAGN
jgi:hypothetical protein